MFGEEATQKDKKFYELIAREKVTQAKILFWEGGVNPLNNGSVCLRKAIANGDKEAFEFLLPISDPKAQESLALQVACFYDRTDMLRELMPVSDPLAQRSGALYVAVEGGHYDCADILLPHSDPRPRLEETLTMLDKQEFGGMITTRDKGCMAQKLIDRATQLNMQETLATPAQTQPIRKQRL